MSAIPLVNNHKSEPLIEKDIGAYDKLKDHCWFLVRPLLISL